MALLDHVAAAHFKNYFSQSQYTCAFQWLVTKLTPAASMFPYFKITNAPEAEDISAVWIHREEHKTALHMLTLDHPSARVWDTSVCVPMPVQTRSVWDESDKKREEEGVWDVVRSEHETAHYCMKTRRKTKK